MSREPAPLYVATYALTRDVFALAVRLPRQHRSVLAHHLQSAAFDALVAITLALQLTGGRAAHLDDADAALTRLRLAVRLGADLGVVSAAGASRMATRVDAIGRQLGGWKRSLRGTGRLDPRPATSASGRPA